PAPLRAPMAAGRRVPSHGDGGAVLLRGRFNTGPCPGSASWSVALTERELQVLRPGGPDAALRLADCVGSSAFPSGPAAACFSLVGYPFRKARWGSPARQRLQRTFRVSQHPEAEENLRIAAHRAHQPHRADLLLPPGASYGVLPRPCRALVLLNPQSGAGRALEDFQAVVQPMLSGGLTALICAAERAHHAQEKVRDEELSQWDVLVVMSGDGLLHEVLNGLMERPDWEEALQTPLCILPGGSGNALAASINYYAG
uniref:sphingosine kinase n=1 Tax=Coturnix japonica TaxID=93934 RepID=A0A8C2YHD4_COTJA